MKSLTLTALLVLALVFSGCSNLLNNDTTTTTTTTETTETSTETDSTGIADGVVTGSNVNYSISYDTSKWTATSAGVGEDAEYEFEHVDGDVYALIIPERIELDYDTLKQIALENAQAVAPDAQITMEENRTVNGVDVLAMKISGTLYGIAFEYYGYYYGGAAGTIQFITYTSQNLTSAYEGDLTELLNGLTITE